MKPYKQGTLDRFCSVYSVINTLVRLGYDLPPQKAQDLYDFVITELEDTDAFFDTAENGADAKRLEQILTSANNYLKSINQPQIKFNRPFYQNKLDFEELLRAIDLQHKANAVFIVDISCSEWEHYSVYNGLNTERIKFFDSSNMPSLKLNSISHKKGEKRYQLHTRQIYCVTKLYPNCTDNLVCNLH